MEKLFDIVHEDENLLVVHKPADLVCHPTKGDEYSSLISRARIYLHRRDEFCCRSSAESQINPASGILHQASGIGSPSSINPIIQQSINPQVPSTHPHLVHRLDRETSGLVVIAKNPATARDLGRIWETREVRKEYLAIVHGHVLVEQGIIDAPLGKDLQSKVAIKDCVRPDGVPAQTEFQVLKRFFHALGEANTDVNPLSPALPMNRDRPTTNPLSPNSLVDNDKADSVGARVCDPQQYSQPDGGQNESHTEDQAFSLLRLLPQTGRKHQIRIHLSHFGHSIVGDKIYGGDEDAYLALVEGRLTPAHRRRLILPHHALHAARITFTWNGKTWDFSTPPEPWFSSFA